MCGILSNMKIKYTHENLQNKIFLVKYSLLLDSIIKSVIYLPVYFCCVRLNIGDLGKHLFKNLVRYTCK